MPNRRRVAPAKPTPVPIGDAPALLKVADVARIANVSTHIVNRWIRDGVTVNGRVIKLTAVAYGDRFRVELIDLDEFRDRCTRAKLGDGDVRPRCETPAANERRGQAAYDRLMANLERR